VNKQRNWVQSTVSEQVMRPRYATASQMAPGGADFRGTTQHQAGPMGDSVANTWLNWSRHVPGQRSQRGSKRVQSAHTGTPPPASETCSTANALPLVRLTAWLGVQTGMPREGRTAGPCSPRHSWGTSQQAWGPAPRCWSQRRCARRTCPGRNRPESPRAGTRAAVRRTIETYASS
jgi:hypothetical protein